MKTENSKIVKLPAGQKIGIRSAIPANFYIGLDQNTFILGENYAEEKDITSKVIIVSDQKMITD